jgi:hypothetical protein
VQPANGSVLFLAPELPSGTVLLRASPPSGAVAVEFLIDGRMIETAEPGVAVLWRLEPGAHVLDVRATLADGRVATAQSGFEVRP